MFFCPCCANVLPFCSGDTGRNMLGCNSCAYEFLFDGQVTSRTLLLTKEVDDVLGGEDMWADVDQTQASCDNCNFGMAYFFQLQTRSADEPMTTFYRCVNCAHRWREN